MQEGFTYKLNDILKLTIEGKYYEAIEETDLVLQKENATKEERIEALILKGKSLFLLSWHESRIECTEEAMEILEEAFQLSEEIKDSLLMFDSLYWILWILNEDRKSKEFLNEYDKFEVIYEDLIREYPSLSDEKKSILLLVRSMSLFNKINVEINFGWKFEETKKLLEKALELTSTKKSDSIEIREMQMFLYNYIAYCNSRIGEYETAIKYRRKALVIAEENENGYEISRILRHIAGAFWAKGDFDQLLEYALKTKEVNEKIGNTRALGHTHFQIGLYHCETGNWKKGFEQFQKSYNILSDDGKREEFDGKLNNLGACCLFMGDYDRAIEFFEKTIEWNRKKGFLYEVNFTLGNLSVVYRNKGEIDKAIEIQKERIAYFKRMGMKKDYGGSLFLISTSYSLKGLFNKSVETLKEALEISDEIGHKTTSIHILTHLVELAVEQNKIDMAQKFYQELKRREEHLEYRISKSVVLYAEAVISKRSNNPRDRVKAELILDQLLSERTEYANQLDLLFQMCDLLLIEMKASSDEKILDKLQKYVNKLIELATKNHVSRMIVQGLWFKSQLSLLVSDFDKAKELLTQAQIIAEDTGLNHLVLKITKSKEELTQQIIKLEDLESTTVTIAQRMDVIKIENGFKEIRTSEKLFSIKI